MNALLQQLSVLTRRSPLIVFSVTLFLLLGLANYFLWQQQQKLTKSLAEKRSNGEAMLLALTGHSKITAQLATVQDALKQIDANLVAEGDLAENLGYFYQIEKLSRLRLSQLNQLSSQPVAADSPYKSIPFSLRLTGSYYQLMSFLHELETGPRLFRVRTFAFSRSGGTANNALSLDLNVELLGKP
jgi:Tfp pilus assembly protein PilO